MRSVMKMIVVPTAYTPTPNEVHDLQGEPKSQGAEEKFPDARGQRLKRRHEHPCHRHSHGDMGDVDINMGGPIPQPSRHETPDAVERRQEHHDGKAVDQPGGLHGAIAHHSERLLPSAPSTGARASTPPPAGRATARCSGPWRRS